MTAARTVIHVNFRREPPKRPMSTTVPRPARKPRLPRIVGLLALAHEIERQIAAGSIRDHAEAARRLGWTRARVSQVAKLTLLAPIVQAAILDLPPVTTAHDPVTERQLRPIAVEPDWNKQLSMWRELGWTST